MEARIGKIAADLAAHGPTDDEVSRARSPLLENKPKDCEANECWVSTITDVLAKRDIGKREARPWQSQTDYLPTLRSLKREDFQALAQRYFVDSRLIRVHILPGAKATESDDK